MSCFRVTSGLLLAGYTVSLLLQAYALFFTALEGITTLSQESRRTNEEVTIHVFGPYNQGQTQHGVSSSGNVGVELPISYFCKLSASEKYPVSLRGKLYPSDCTDGLNKNGKNPELSPNELLLMMCSNDPDYTIAYVFDRVHQHSQVLCCKNNTTREINIAKATDLSEIDSIDLPEDKETEKEENTDERGSEPSSPYSYPNEENEFIQSVNNLRKIHVPYQNSNKDINSIPRPSWFHEHENGIYEHIPNMSNTQIQLNRMLALVQQPQPTHSHHILEHSVDENSMEEPTLFAKSISTWFPDVFKDDYHISIITQIFISIAMYSQVLAMFGTVFSACCVIVVSFQGRHLHCCLAMVSVVTCVLGLMAALLWDHVVDGMFRNRWQFWASLASYFYIVLAAIPVLMCSLFHKARKHEKRDEYSSLTDSETGDSLTQSRDTGWSSNPESRRPVTRMAKARGPTRDDRSGHHQRSRNMNHPSNTTHPANYKAFLAVRRNNTNGGQRFSDYIPGKQRLLVHPRESTPLMKEHLRHSQGRKLPLYSQEQSNKHVYTNRLKPALKQEKVNPPIRENGRFLENDKDLLNHVNFSLGSSLLLSDQLKENIEVLDEGRSSINAAKVKIIRDSNYDDAFSDRSC